MNDFLMPSDLGAPLKFYEFAGFLDNATRTPSVTDFIFLTEQVAHLERSFEWIVGGIGITVAVALAILSFVQYVYVRKIQKEEIEGLKRDLEEHLRKEIDDKALKLEAFVEESLLSMEGKMEEKTSKIEAGLLSRYSDFEEQTKFLEAEIARHFAIYCENKDFHSTAVNWWLRAANLYSETEHGDLFIISVKAAKESLEKIKAGDATQIEGLVEKMTRNNQYLDGIGLKHPSESSLLRNLLNLKTALPEASA